MFKTFRVSIFEFYFFMPDKKVYMWLCAGGTLAVIAIIWVASIKFSIGASVIELGESKKKGVEAFGDFQKNFTKQMEDLQNKFSAPTTTLTVTSTTK